MVSRDFTVQWRHGKGWGTKEGDSSLNFRKIVENLIFVGKCLSLNAKLDGESPILGKCVGTV